MHKKRNNMAWGKPTFSKEQYTMAGRVLINGDRDGMEMDEALTVINNWRSSHYHPLNTFQRRLRLKASEVDGNSIVAQRIKRMSSIKHKLERFNTMRIIQIQDIAGCRAILSTVEHVEKLVEIMSSKDKKRSGRGMKHKLIWQKDYIKEPKPSGYRGVHFIFEYHSDKQPDYNNLKIEIQFRTFLQHTWATAVETAGLFTGQALKSSIGASDWLRFFTLVSSAMAASEGTPTVEGTPTGDLLRAEIRSLNNKLDVRAHLSAYKAAINIVNKERSEGGDHYFLLKLDTQNKTIAVKSYKNDQLEQAASEYLEVEKEVRDLPIDAVLVAADSVSTLKKAYPNYFADTEMFLKFLDRIIA